MSNGDTPTVEKPEPLRSARPSLTERYRRIPRAYLFGPLLLFPYVVAMHFARGVGALQISIVLLTFVLCYWNDATRAFLKGLLAFLVFGVVYDLSHLTEPLVRYLHVHIAPAYDFDKRFFGIHTAAGVLTPNEFFAIHHCSFVDFFTGLSYIIFIYWAIAFAVYLTVFRKEKEMKRLLLQYGWVFFFVNLAGIITYYVYPSAPPWYAAHYGFGPPDFAHIVASPAAAIRWDQLTGIHYFQAFYAASADIFGAIPSLHVTYPLLVFIYARRVGNRTWNVINFLFFLLVCFSAVYLQHHYVLDVLLGILYVVVAVSIERVISGYVDSRRKRREQMAAT